MMISILTKILFAVSILLTCYSLYFVIIALWGLSKKRERLPHTAPQTRFAMVVAARNEAAVIGHLIDSMNAQNYPKELFSVIAAPNNCTDNTAEIAAQHGARVFEPQGIIKSKGEVLTQIVDEIVIGENFDAMCVFDADNLVDENFLQHMNDAIANGAQVVQGFRDSKNPRQSAMSGCYSICYWMLNRFYNRGRAALGLSALVNGSGFAVTRTLLEKLGGWHTQTMTEDYEFSAQCACAGERVHFVSEARVFDEQPLTFSESWKQRRRWTTGSLQGLYAYGHKLFEQVVLQRSLVCFDMYLTFLTPIVQVVSFAAAVCGLTLAMCHGFFIVFGVIFTSLDVIALSIAASVLGMVVGSAILAAVTVLLQRAPVQGMGKSIALYWLFLMSHTVLTFISFVSQKTTWDPIAHTASKSLEQLRSTL